MGKPWWSNQLAVQLLKCLWATQVDFVCKCRKRSLLSITICLGPAIQGRIFNLLHLNRKEILVCIRRFNAGRSNFIKIYIPSFAFKDCAQNFPLRAFFNKYLRSEFQTWFSSYSVFNFQLPQNPIKLHRNLIYKPAPPPAAVVAGDNAMDGRSGTKSKKQFFPHSSAFNMIWSKGSQNIYCVNKSDVADVELIELLLEKDVIHFHESDAVCAGRL